MAARYDLVRGTYRRQYSGFLRGRRICSVTIGAEAWFWRLHALADDWGRFEADPALLARDASGRREITQIQSEEWIAELIGANLVMAYYVRNTRHLAIIEFTSMQPAPKSGNRICRVPEPDPVRCLDNLSVPVRLSPSLSPPAGSDSYTDSGGSEETEKPKSHKLLWGHVQPIYDAYPKLRRGGTGPFTDAVGPAWSDLVGSGEKEPGSKLLKAVKAYAGSWLATNEGGKACVGPIKFFAHGGVWAQDPQDWIRPNGSGVAPREDHGLKRGAY